MKDALLEQLGLNSKEITIFQAILRSGRVNPASLAKLVGIKRTTAYSLARGLVEKGLIVEDATTRPRTFAIAPPDAVVGLIVDEKKRLQDREATIRRLAEELSQTEKRSHYPVPTLRFIEENKLAKFLYQQMQTWDTSILESKETTWWGFQDHSFVEEYGDWIRAYWEQSPENIDLKLLSNRAESEVKFGTTVTPRRFIKYWGEATLFRSTLWAIGNYVVMINTRNRPFYLVEIHDELMANDQREVFKNLWPLV